MKNKNIISLNGKWNFIKDPDEKLKIENIKSHVVKKKVFSSMYVPSNWEKEGLHNFNGSVWFIKKIPSGFISNLKNNSSIDKENLVTLCFDGVDYFADVWLNWNFIGHHEGYFQPFNFDITDLVKYESNLPAGQAENIIVVKVTSPFEEPGKVWPLRKKLIKGIFNHHDCRPGAWNPKTGQDQNTGGIWNDVYIKYGYKVFIENIKITSTFNESYEDARLHFNFKYNCSGKLPIETKIEFQIISPANKKVTEKIQIFLQPGKNDFSHSINISHPQLWWSWDFGEQNLYDVIISSEDFEMQELKFGFRDVKLDKDQQVFLNGKRIFLRGTNIIPTQFLSELTNEKIERIVTLIKKANINVVRVHAHVNRKELYDEFDKQGILIWQDFSLQWTYDTSTIFADNAVTQIKEMVRTHYNHPSIVFWCCHNEPGEQIYSLDPLLRQAVMSEDSSRIIRTASNYEEHPYDGWYWGNKEHFAAAPMGPLVTEFGAQGLPEKESLKKFINKNELFPPHWETWEYHDFQVEQTFNIAKVEMGKSIDEFILNSQKYQSDLIETAVNFYRRKKFKGITGIFQFMFIDCWPSITWSVVDFYEKPKPAYETLKKVYQPVFISTNVRQDQYFPGKKLLLDFYIINDYHKKFNNCKLNLLLDGKKFQSIKNINLKEDDLIFINYESFEFILPQKISLGNHKIDLELVDNSNKILSKNFFSIKVVKNIKIQ